MVRSISEMTRFILSSILLALVLSSGLIIPENVQAVTEDLGRPRLIILADMGNEPDEEQQMVHMLMYSNEFDLEGLVAVTGKFLKQGPRPELFHKLIDGYGKVVGNLELHASGWPAPDYLHGITVAGQHNYGIADVGKGKSSPGSRLIVKAVLRNDPRPINIVINAGSNTLAQALWDYRDGHTQQEVRAFVAKLRVYGNGAQDNAGAWIAREFPSIHWVRSNHQTYGYMGKGGPYCWEPYPETNQGQHKWAKEHIQQNHGALGALYPDRFGGRGFLEGGGTTPWIGLVNKGMYDPEHQWWGGWGGRFTRTKQKNVWSRHDDVKRDEQEYAPFYMYDAAGDSWTDPAYGNEYRGVYTPVWRWRRHMLNDLQHRMDWCVRPYERANHNPVTAFRGDSTDSIIHLNARPGDTISLDASASADPDGDSLSFKWFVYPEAGTYSGIVDIAASSSAKATATIPQDALGKQIHVIVQVWDNSNIVSMYDYRRIVIDVRD